MGVGFFEYANRQKQKMVDYYKSPGWAAKRNERLRIDGYKCAKCGFTRALEVHHINYERFGDEDVGRDLITLCKIIFPRSLCKYITVPLSFAIAKNIVYNRAGNTSIRVIKIDFATPSALISIAKQRSLGSECVNIAVLANGRSVIGHSIVEI